MAPLIVPADAAGIAQAAELLKSGALVAFPTETVYGLGADARNREAVQAIFAAKGRPADHPVIVHLADPAAMSGTSGSIRSSIPSRFSSTSSFSLQSMILSVLSIVQLLQLNNATAAPRLPVHQIRVVHIDRRPMVE